MNQKQRDSMFARWQEQNPKPETELNYRNPFELLTAVMLSAQATDIAVNKVTGRLFAKARTPKSILALGEAGLKPYLRTLGLFNSKTKHLLATCKILLTQYDGQVPKERKALEALPGVGRKTANVVLNCAFGEPTIAVDTHIFRVGNRTGLAPGKTPLMVEKALLKNVSKRYQLHAHHWLILHGRYCCKARKPLCYQCIVSDICEFNNKTPKP